MKRLIVDPQKCTGCKACELTCSFVKEGVFMPFHSRIHIERFVEIGVNVPIVCVNCARPACAEVCPTEAIGIDRKVPGVRIDRDACVGCGECVKACPFGAVELNEEKGVAYVCDLCGGDPSCVSSCIYGALSIRERHRVGEQKRRAAAESYALATQTS